VRQPFAGSYLTGQTPNPCALCNREIKFGRFLREALDLTGADFMATGHYADTLEVGGRLLLREPLESRKSQIYFLALISPAVLSRVRFPLARHSLDEVRAMTRDLPLVNRDESQDVCFLGGEKLAAFLARELDGDVGNGGEIVDENGQLIGHHQGLHHYTIGQRRGVGLAGKSRLYVIAKDMESNRLQLGPESLLFTERIDAAAAVYWRPLVPGEALMVKIRYQTPARPVLVTRVDEQGFSLRLEEPISAVTPGQIAVLYDGDCIVAGGEIMTSERA
jgi:tRNA-specific 2-thiouridylase